MQKTKKFLRIILCILFFLISCIINFYICGIAGAILFNEIPDTLFVVYMIITPFVISSIETALLVKAFNKRQGANENNSANFGSVPVTRRSVPFFKKKQTAMAEDLLSDISLHISLANKATCVSSFIEWYDKALNGFEQLMQFDKAPFKGSPVLDYYRLKDEFQWHLCDAIVRAKEKTIADITNKYKNSREFQNRCAESFKRDISSIRSRCSADTLALADAALSEIQELVGSDKSSPQDDHENVKERATRYHDVADELSRIDLMEGHAFEYWCADLLSDIGYVDVSVTRASGDYGVDVLASKDGVRYAIQCKCYGKDLGSEPIREVNSGKSMPIYNCHVGAVMTNRYFTKNAIAEAEANHILLWDRDWIADKLRTLNRTVVPSPSISQTPPVTEPSATHTLSISQTPLVTKPSVTHKPTSSSGNPPISEDLSQFIHKAQWYASSKDDDK